MPAPSSVTGKRTAAAVKLVVDGNPAPFWGKNAATAENIFGKGVGVNNITWTHAEGDVLTQAAGPARTGLQGKTATMYGDEHLCDLCEKSRGVENMAAFLGLRRLTVVTPKGTLVFEW